MSLTHRNYLVTETAISAVINAGFSAAFAFLVFGGAGRIELWGSPSLALDFLPQTFMVALMSVFVPTLLTRRRVRSGKVPSGVGSSRLPRNLLLRGFACAAITTIVLGGLAVAGVTALALGPMSFPGVLALKVVYGAAVALVVTPFAIRVALAD